MLNADIKDFEFTSEHDGLVISAVIALPSGEPNGVVQLVHGMNEHKERYYPFMDYLAEEGFITVIHDNRGHGRSICSPDDLGFMFKDGGEGFVSDIAQLTRIVRETYPQLPIFMIGHSMGSLGVRCFLKKHDNMINGTVLLGCPCYSRFSGIIRTINSELVKNLGSRYRSEKIYDISESVLNRNFDRTLPHSWICSEKEVVDAFNADPLCNFRYTMNGYEGLLWLFHETYSKRGWQMQNPRLPIRFISGADDPCMLSQKKFFKAVALLEKLGYDSISHRLFEGMRHEVLNERNSAAVWKDIAKTLFSWIDRFNEDAADKLAAQEMPQE
ncbi:MAG: alpha/beta hydrolase [Ruminococcus sp.]|nr:alpha/beta hydrolase [Ruminococcus sp.]